MENNKTKITVGATVNVPVEKAWEYFTGPEHVIKWNSASDDWHTPKAENDLHAGGKFSYRMEAKDGSFGFDFAGIYDTVELNKTIEYTLGDDRKVSIDFEGDEQSTVITEIFEAETMNSPELQKTGWQAILDNFKKYAESEYQPQ